MAMTEPVWKGVSRDDTPDTEHEQLSDIFYHVVEDIADEAEEYEKEVAPLYETRD